MRFAVSSGWWLGFCHPEWRGEASKSNGSSDIVLPAFFVIPGSDRESPFLCVYLEISDKRIISADELLLHLSKIS